MARFKPYSYAQKLMIPVDLSEQLQPGTFEFALNQLVDEMDLSIFNGRFLNDETVAQRHSTASTAVKKSRDHARFPPTMRGF
jgi:hypothetical protein